MYAKYQEAADALHHEELGRKQTQAILERVCFIEPSSICLLINLKLQILVYSFLSTYLPFSHPSEFSGYTNKKLRFKLFSNLASINF